MNVKWETYDGKFAPSMAGKERFAITIKPTWGAVVSLTLTMNNGGHKGSHLDRIDMVVAPAALEELVSVVRRETDDVVLPGRDLVRNRDVAVIIHRPDENGVMCIDVCDENGGYGHSCEVDDASRERLIRALSTPLESAA